MKYFLPVAFCAATASMFACGSHSFDPDSTPKTSSDDGSPEPSPTTAATVETTLDLTACGFDVTKPSALLVSGRLGMDPFKQTIATSLLGGGIFPIQTEVTFSGTVITEGSLVSQVVTYSGSGAPVMQEAAFKEVIAGLQGASEAELVVSVDRAKIGVTYPEWAGLFCTLQPAKKLINTSAGRVVVEFSQPIPFGVLAKSSLERLQAELATKRTFSKITAKVTESNDPNLVVGTSFSGTVAAFAAVPNAVPGVSADMGVTIDYDFGGPEKNHQIGLPTSMSWYLDSVSHAVKGMQIKNGNSTVRTYK